MQVKLASAEARIRSLDEASTHEACDKAENCRLHLVESAKHLASGVQLFAKAHDLAMQQLEVEHHMHDMSGNFRFAIMYYLAQCTDKVG